MSFIKSIATFSSFTMISRLTGFIRDMIIARYLGASFASDAFLISFKLPNLFRNLFAEGAFSSAFVPLFTAKLVEKGSDSSIKFAAKAISLLTFALIILTIIFETFMPSVIRIIAPGFVSDANKFNLTVELCRITFPFLLFISIVSFQGGILNSLGYFAAPASAPIILNLSIIFMGLFSVFFLETPVYGMALAITVAGILEMFWLKYFLNKLGIYIKPFYNIKDLIKDSEIVILFKKIAPGIVGAGIYQINMMVDTIIVSLVSGGAVSWLYYANRIQQLPLGVIGAAISVALLPLLSKKLKNNEKSEAKSLQDKAILYGLLLSLPAAIIFVCLSNDIIKLLFEYGKFTSSDTNKTSLALQAYAIGLPCYVMVKALMPNFFARGDTKTPVKYSLVVFIINFSLNILLMQKFEHVGIAIATSISAFASLGQYIYGLHKHKYWSFSKELLNKIYKTILSCLVMGIIMYITKECFESFVKEINIFTLIVKLGLIGILGLATFLIMITITNIIDILPIIQKFVLRRKSYDK